MYLHFFFAQNLSGLNAKTYGEKPQPCLLQKAPKQLVFPYQKSQMNTQHIFSYQKRSKGVIIIEKGSDAYN